MHPTFNKIFFIKLVHSIIFFFMSACLVYILYAGITRTYNWALLSALLAIASNGLALLFNRGRCPLTTMAEKAGAEKGSVTDIFLPGFMARNVFMISSVLFTSELVLLGTGYFMK